MHASELLPPTPTSAHIAENTARQYVTFTCCNRSFGIDIMSVREIRSWQPTTELPGQPHGAKGVLDIRGRVVQVYDLAMMIGAGSQGQPASGQVVLVVSLAKADVGVVVDAVSDIIFATPETMRQVPGSAQKRDSMVSTLVKIDDRLISILDLTSLFPDDVVYLD